MAEESLLPGAVRVPGQLVLGLAPEVAAGLDVSVPAGPSRGALAGVTDLGVPEVDHVLAGLGVVDVARVHPPMPPPPPGLLAASGDAAMVATFRVRFDAERDPDDAVRELSGAAGVVFAEPVLLREATATPNDSMFPQQWGLAKIRCPEAWDRTTGDPSVVVAVVDTGVDLDHPELAPLLLPGFDAVDLGPSPGAPMPGWVWEGDFAGRDNVPQDEVGHGTHVAGTIACVSNEGTGVAGVTWDCRLLPVKVLNRARRLSDNRISGFGTSVDIAAGVQWAADHGARVINLSLGGQVETTVERNAIAHAVSRGCVVVAAMGNTGNAVPQFPASFPDVLAVAAVDSGDRVASFSSRGTHVGVSAPGVGVLSTYWDNTHATSNGTSMASPHVAGVAALVLSVAPTLGQAQVRQVLRETARPLRDDPTDPVPNDRYGSGLVDARAAIDRAAPVLRTSPLITCGRVTQPVICRESLVIRCPSRPLVTCGGGSLPVRCPSVAVRCVSEVVRCPTVDLRCPSAALRCPSALVCPSGRICDRPDFPDIPDRPFGISAEDDPYGVDYGGGEW